MHDQRKSTLLALMAVGLWSTVATAFKLSLRQMDPLQLVAYASLFATLVLLASLALQRRLDVLWSSFRRQPALYMVLGCLNPLLYYIVLFKAYDLLPAQQAQSINYTWAITLGLLSVPFLRRQYTARDALAALIGYAGVLVIATRGDLMALEFDSPAGVALALFSTVVWAAFWIIHSRMIVEPLTGLCLSFLCGLPFTFLACAVYSSLVPVSPAGLLGAAYIGMFEMGITYVIWLTALKAAANVAKISNLIFLSPFLSLVPISLILDETIVPATLFGLALVVTGTFVQQFHRRD